MQSVRRLSEKNKKQPVATWEPYEASVKAMRQLALESESDAERTR